VGIDLGITDFATLSNGEKIKAPKPLKKNLKKLKRFQRSLSRKNKGSKRREKARLRVAKLHTKIKNVREDFLHKLSTRLARENQRIVLEDLNTAGLMKNRCLSRAISDLGWRQFRTFLEAKTEKYGRELRVIDRWEPTSQKCSCCGFRGGKLDLSIREWECLNCGAIHDRDTNAAINILVAGGHSETCPERSRRTKNGRGDKRKTTSKVAAVNEASTRSEFKPKQLTLFDLDGWESQCL
jgi:putative transposase